MFSDHTAPHFNMITYLPSTHAVAALLPCQTAPFSLCLLHSYWRAPASLALCISACPLLSPPLSTKPDPAFTSASQAASTNARFQSPPDVKFQPSPRNPPPCLGYCIGGRKTLLCSRLCKEYLQGSSSTGLSWRAASTLVLITQSRSLPPLLLALPFYSACLFFLFTLHIVSCFFCVSSSVWCDKINCLCWAKPLPWAKSLPLL